MEIKNFMEHIVLDLVKDVTNNMNVCNCEKCLMDITAIALNNLPPKYIVSEKGELFSKVDTLKKQFEIDSVTAITKAALIVINNPRHSTTK